MTGERIPSVRRARADYVNKRARAEMVEGLDAGKNFTRRYDEKYEYMVRGDPFPDCKKTYMGACAVRPAPVMVTCR